jgi:TolB-like protein/Flp pilus assembly protein TadD
MTEQRRLAAILVADVVGYSKLVGRDETGTLARLSSLRSEVIEPQLAKFGGRLFKSVGDGFLVEFASAVQAVSCANAIQEANVNGRLTLRIGIHVGDVVVQGDDLMGDGVNLAARIEGFAEAGGVAVSQQVHDQVRGKVGLAFVDKGEISLKNIEQRVHVFALAGAGRTIPTSALAVPDKPSIAVLPFQNMSGDPEQEYFADGIVEDILTALSRFKSLFVIARNSTFTYKGRAVDIKQVGHELGVRYVLEGSVRKAGTRVRITGQLVEAASGTHLWAERFDGALEDVFDLQDRISSRVVSVIVPTLDRAEADRAKSKHTENLSAYDHYLRGLARLSLLNKEGTSDALDHFREAIRLDPTFSTVHAWASIIYSRRRQSRWMMDIERESEEGLRLGRKAIDLAPDDALALAAGGFAIAFLGGDLDAGLAFIDRALGLNPNLALAWQASGWVRSYIGDPDTAIEHLSQAVRLTPVDPQMAQLYLAMAIAMRCAGRYADSATWAKKALGEAPGLLPALICLATAQALAGQLAEARQTADRALQLDPHLRTAIFSNSVFFRRAQDREALLTGVRLAGIPE